MRRFIAYGPALVVLMTVVVVLLAGPAAIRRIGSAQTSARIVLAQRSLDDDDILERLNKAVRNVAETVRPSVVHIEVIPTEGRRALVRSTGTGWVYDSSGYIVTNAHVVRGALAISVQFSDGRVVESEAIRGEPFVADVYTDIAVIKVPESDDVFAAKRATGIQPQQGDHVFVFGSPFGFKFSMSHGIVSGLGRAPSAAAEFEGYTNYIQTDAAVNPGNSGGPLVDIKGRVIGMNVAIATARNSDGTTTDEGQSAGISFAIPLGTIESVADQLIASGQVRRGFMGIQFGSREVPVTDIPGFRGTGIRITRVTADGPADIGGLKSGDIVLEIDGQRVGASEVLRSLISSARPGQSVRIKVRRQGEVKDCTVALIERPREEIAKSDLSAASGALARYGLVVGSSSEGPFVRRVMEESAAAEAGFKRGQVILRVGEANVRTAESVYLAAAEQGLLLGRRLQVTIADVGSDQAGAPRTLDLQVLK